MKFRSEAPDGSFAPKMLYCLEAKLLKQERGSYFASIMTQEQALHILKLGHNAYITGAAGSGKTHLLRQYISYLKENDVDVGITASTGIAATHMGGVTIHSWSGLGIRDNLSDYDLEALEEKQYLWKRMEKVKVLIIDEVSMLHHFRLDLVEKIVRAFKRNQMPFGGIQVILCGDFFQLPPVSRAGEPEAHFVYKAESWAKAGFKVCYLEEQFRQTDDVCYQILNDIRTNHITETTRNHLRGRYKKALSGQSGMEKLGTEGMQEMQGTEGFQTTRLHTHNIDVDGINNKELEKIEGIVYEYEMESRGKDFLVDILKKSCLAPEKLRLKVGTRVMFVKNNPEVGFANGTLGTVIACDAYSGPTVKTSQGNIIRVAPMNWSIEEDGKVKAELSQYPLRLAWAITVHKSQGMSLDAIEVDLSKTFEKGMGYVALSRLRTLNGLTLLGLNEMALQVNPEILEFDDQLKEMSEDAQQELFSIDEATLKEREEEFLAKIVPPESLRKKKKLLSIKKQKDQKIIERLKKAEEQRRQKQKEKEQKSASSPTNRISSEVLTRTLLQDKLSLKEIAEARELKIDTILQHVEDIVDADSTIDISHLKKELSDEKFKKVKKAFEEQFSKEGNYRYGAIKLALGNDYSYNDIRLTRLFLGLPRYRKPL
jgi:ATP-dependent exoDNAse (exonuclease V) alpha subunit